MSVNFSIIEGNLTRDPEIKFLANDKCVAKVSLAHNRRYKVNGETREETLFIDGEAWGHTAELLGKYFSKGKGIIIQGALKQDTWDDKETGKKRSRISIRIDQVHFTHDPKRAETTGSAPASAPAPDAGSAAAPASAATTAGPRSTPGDDEPPF